MSKKREFRYFTINNHKKEEEYLRRMHNSGWRFVKVTGLGVYHFESCTPEDVVYQLDYAAENKGAEYIRLFTDCGWEYIQEYVGYSYFRKSVCDMNGEEEIFSDGSSRIAMMERVFKGRLTPLLVIFSAVLMPQFIINLTAGNYGIAAIHGGILALYIGLFVSFAIQYHRLKNKN